MKKISAGILLWKRSEKGLKVFLVHPGGPFWAGKNEKAWDFPKGEVEEGESDLLVVGIRELKEETGIDVSSRKREEFISLGSIRRKDGKEIHLWAIESDWSGLLMCQSMVEMEYPLRSGKKILFPEVDKAGFFTLQDAKKKVFVSLVPFLERLEQQLKN
jgi:predicted NUDIX family NTP pyrophosphohydrolase